MRKVIFLLVCAAAFSGCASVKLSEAGHKVRLVTSTPHNCQYLGEVFGEPKGGLFVNDLDAAGLHRMLQNDLKNNTAARGGNTVEVTGKSDLSLSGEAYRCEYNDGPTPASITP